jgi:hypothetical protein
MDPDPVSYPENNRIQPIRKWKLQRIEIHRLAYRFSIDF